MISLNAWVKSLISFLGVACLASLPGCCLPGKEARSHFYPIGIYAVNSTNDFQIVKEAGFNLVKGRAEKAYLDSAEAAGLKVLAAPATKAGKEFNAGAARAAVQAYDRHPALWAWYLADEPDLNDVPPEDVATAHRFLKTLGARKPTAIVLYQGYEALNYGKIPDLLMVDRYPIPWLPLANFGQHVTMARLALGKRKPLIAVIQAFDWSSYPGMVPGAKDLRPPTYEEMRCMTYEALARGANGLFYYAFDSDWKMREHPETWAALKAVIKEVRERLPLFGARPQWWPKDHVFGDPTQGFNAALESSVTSTLLRVKRGDKSVPPGDYVLAVNNTDRTLEYSFALPCKRGRAKGERRMANGELVPVLGEKRFIRPEKSRVRDTFGPYAVHVYGPLGCGRRGDAETQRDLTRA